MPFDDGHELAVTLADLDRDGDLDLLTGNRLYENDGAGVFADVTASRMPPGPLSPIGAADIDGDGDLDVASGARVLANLQRELDAPNAARIGQPYTLDIYRRDASWSLAQFALAYLSTTPANVALPGIGTLGIVPELALAPVFVPQPAGVVSMTWLVPNLPNLAGLTMRAQALIADYPQTARLSNVLVDVVR